MFDLQDHLTQRKKLVETALYEFTPSLETTPSTLHKAIHHSLFAGGKRLRPILTLAAAQACNFDPKQALRQAAAVEMIHTFSLIHDDLPCMDDDDLRRGKPTCHVVYGEAIALLAGDALQSLAFEILANSGQENAAQQVALLAQASGSTKLIGGQVLDLEGEQTTITKISGLEEIHQAKTGALLSASLQLGAMAANASEEKQNQLAEFGLHLGLAFQIIDDILDITANAKTLGKSAGKDVAAGKSTYPSLLGLEESRAQASKRTDLALNCLASWGEEATALKAIAAYLLKRSY